MDEYGRSFIRMTSFKIINGNIFGPDCEFYKGDIAITDGLIVNDVYENAEIIDAENLYVIPGLVDIHFHGCKGHDFCEGTQEAFKAIRDYEASIGVTTICPATMTLPEEKLLAIMHEARNFHDLAGIYLEGPFISSSKVGAQNPDYVHKPNIDMLKRLQGASGGLIRIAAIAPEVEGAREFIAEAKNITRLSLAHTACNYETANEAFNIGVSQVTHLYNAMPPINHREPGPIIAALENRSISVEIICDGIHVHPAIVRNTIKAFGSDRIIFISDSMEATGMPDGKYKLGGLDVIKQGNKATLLDGVTIAGSVTNLLDCMKTAIKNMNVPLEVAIKCSTLNPAKAIGLFRHGDLHGVIQTGKRADLIALDKELNTIWVMNNGTVLFWGNPKLQEEKI